MEGHCSTGQSPQRAVVPMGEEEEEEEEERGGGGRGRGGEILVTPVVHKKPENGVVKT